MIRVTVWGENVHEQKNKVVAGIYPNGMHTTIADALNRDAGMQATTVTLQDAEHGLTDAKLAETDVLIWWGMRRMARFRMRLPTVSAMRSGAGWGRSFCIPRISPNPSNA